MMVLNRVRGTNNDGIKQSERAPQAEILWFYATKINSLKVATPGQLSGQLVLFNSLAACNIRFFTCMKLSLRTDTME